MYLFIRDFLEGDNVDQQFLVSNVVSGVSNANKPYLSITLQDATGTIEAKKWDVYPGDEDVFDVSNVVNVSGQVYSYKGKLQMKIFDAFLVNDDAADFTKLVPTSPVSQETLVKEMKDLLKDIKDPEISVLTTTLINKYYDSYITHPAAVRNHHAFLNGLLFHSVTMAKTASALCNIYPSLNKDVMIAGSLIHDLGKIVELSGPVGTQYTLEGRLIGHICIMQAEVRNVCDDLIKQGKIAKDSEIPLIFEHMIISHHTRQEYGSPIFPATREALALGMIDDFDAKMQTLDKAFSGVEPGEWTQRLFCLENHSFYNPFYSQKKGE